MRKFIITVNGNEYEVDVEEVGGGVASTPKKAARPAPAAQPAKAAPAPKTAPKQEEPAKDMTVSAGGESVEAPMPGTVLSINVSEGDSVSEGDTLMILEAMKMENEILAPCGGVVKAIGASEGAAVNTGDKLIVIE